MWYMSPSIELPIGKLTEWKTHRLTNYVRVDWIKKFSVALKV